MSKGQKGAISGGYQAMKLASMLTPELSRVVKKLGVDRVYKALTDDDEMEVFARDVYAELPINLRTQITLEQLIPMIMSNKKRIMKKKKNQNKVEKHSKK